MKVHNVETTARLIMLLQQLPPDVRPTVLQEAASFRPSETLEQSVEVGPLRAAFAAEWERQFTEPVPIDPLRRTLDVPVPIATVLPFLQLKFAKTEHDLTEVVARLLDHLHERIGELQRPNQLALFPVEQRPPASRTSEPHVGSPVDSLSQLVRTGIRFPTVYADPPWRYSNSASRAAAENHYPTLSLEQICAEPVRDLVDDNAHLHLWTTSSFLREAFAVIEAWGFEYKSCLVWVKNEIGLGNYWRVSHEYLMLGVRGRLTFRDRTQPSWILAPRTVHSRKPGIVRSLIEKVSPGPYLELYGREELPGSAWTVYGNQVERRLF